MADDDFCYLTTTGRRSGRSHRIEIWYARSGDTLYLLAGGGRTSDWVRNIEHHPRVHMSVGGVDHEAVARILDNPRDAPEARLARELLYEKYQPRYEGPLDDWRDRSLPVAIDLLQG